MDTHAATIVWNQKLISLLLHCKLIKKDQLENISHKKDLARTNLLDYLVEHKILDVKSFMIKSANFFHLQYINLIAINVRFLPKDFFEIDFCRKKHCLPLFIRKQVLYVAIANPVESQEILKILRDKYNKPTRVIIGELNYLKEKIEEFDQYLKDGRQIANDDPLIKIMEDVELGTDFIKQKDLLINNNENDEAPIIKFINNIIINAVQKNASDIHFEPYEKNFRIRYRIDGLLVETFRTTKNLGLKVASRLKIMANLDIAEKRIPQDGKFKISLSHDKSIDFRISTCPMSFGEKIAVRIIDYSNTQIPVEALGFAKYQKKLYLDTIHQSQGMVLATGPTGSGKTVTLYTGISILNKTEKNISTVEDPVELTMAGVNQVGINNKQGLTFAAALKAFLRQDPDIIMVGEIRDIETASIAIKASQTGHLVMSTLHTNSAPETLNRLVDMGLPRYNIATSISLIIAQRLIRKLCPNCRLKNTKINFPIVLKENDLNDDILLKTFDTTLNEIEKSTIYTSNPKGCSKCSKGYKGRLGLYEVMPVSKEISKMILKNKNTLEIAQQAQKEGIATVRQSALVRVADEGLTTIKEAYRVS